MKINIFGDFVCQLDKLPVIDETIIRYIEHADLNIVNFEAPICTEDSSPIEKSGPALRQVIGAPSYLESTGFNVITVANNHFMDYGEDAAIESMSSFKKAQLLGAGYGENAYKPLIVEECGLKVGFISLTHFEFGTLSDENCGAKKFGTAWINSSMVDSIVKQTSEQVDFLIVLPHAGIENITQPLPEWRSRYRQFIDLGADLVIASHPHIIQGSEVYKGKDIFYSLGNFFFPWLGADAVPNTWYNGMSVQLEITQSGIKTTPFFTKFTNDIISIDEDSGLSLFVESSNVLKNNKEYEVTISKECKDLLPLYYDLFYYSGYVKIGVGQWLKKCLKIILNRTKTSNTHIINNLRCESHRYAIIRALESNMK